MPSINTRNGSFTASAVVLTAMLLVSGSIGCSQANLYTVRNLPAQFHAAPVANAQTLNMANLAGPTVSTDLISRGDVLEVSIAAGLNADAITEFLVRVGDDGAVLLPEIGPIPLADLRLMQAEQQIATVCMQRGLYRQPNITVTMKQQQINRITITGGVEEPGIVELPRGSSYLLAVIVAAGGLSEEAGTKVDIRHPFGAGRLASQPGVGPSGVQQASATEPAPGEVPAVVSLNLTEAVKQVHGGGYLYDGSVVSVEIREPEPIQVLGLVRKPGRYDYPVNHELRLFGALAMAEGRSSHLADKVYVLRADPSGEGHASIQVSLRKAKEDAEENLRLMPGDIVSVERTPVTIVADTINRVIRFGMSASIPLF